MINFFEIRERNEEAEQEKYLDPQLWRTCAGGTVQIPPLNSHVFYFTQGHFEHVGANLDPTTDQPRFNPYVLCRVSEVKRMADSETDEVFAKIGLIPVAWNEVDLDVNGGGGGVESEGGPDNLASYAKVLTQSDANNGGGFSVPRNCAVSVFPPLDLSGQTPEQILRVRDVHGEEWTFRHTYRGSPKRHLLTTGWNVFVNRKRLVAGDSVVFMRAGDGDGDGDGNIRVGIRRGGNGGRSLIRRGRVRFEDVIRAASLAAEGKAFDVVYYPGCGNPELFCVRACLVKSALQVHWFSGMKFKMAVEADDCSRVTWFVGTVSSVRVTHPLKWPHSPWKLLEVKWDEPDRLQDVKRVNPWSIQLLSNIPDVHFPPFAPLTPPQLANFPLDRPFPLPTFSNLLGPRCLSDNIPMQGGARHDQAGTTLFNHYFNELHQSPTEASSSSSEAGRDENVSCLLTLAVGGLGQASTSSGKEKEDPVMIGGRESIDLNKNEEQGVEGNESNSGEFQQP